MNTTPRKIGWILIGLMFVYIHGSLIVPLFQDELTYSYGPGLALWQWLVCLGFGITCNAGGMVTTLRPVISGWAGWPVAGSLVLGAGASAYWLVRHFMNYGLYDLIQFYDANHVLEYLFDVLDLVIIYFYFLILWSYSRRAWRLLKPGT